MAEENGGELAASASKRGGIVSMLLNGFGIFGLSLVAVIAGGFVNHRLYPPQEFELDTEGRLTIKKVVAPAEEPHEARPSLYLALDPPLIVNFEDNSSVRFLQLTIEVMAREQSAPDAVSKHNPVIRNNLMLLMSNRDYRVLMTREGKEKLRQEALREVQAILKKETGVPGIEDLLFTSFVVQ